MELLRHIVVASDSYILWYFVAINSVYALLLVLSVPQIWRHWELYKNDEVSKYIAADALPPISILVPAHNMAASIRTNVNCLLSLQYAAHEVIVVNDGSDDATMEELRSAFELYEVPPVFLETIRVSRVYAYYRSRRRANLIVVDKMRGGKADAVNAALNVAQHPLVLTVDADTLIEHDALLRLARPFIVYPDVAAAGATIRVANGCRIENQCVKEARLPRNWLAGVQVPEYLRAFLFGRLGWNALGGNLIISGAFGLFRRDYLLAIGGYEVSSVGEDVELVLRLHRYLREHGIAYRMSFVPDPIAWTEVPDDLRSLRRQRERWHRGLIAALLKNFNMFFNYRYGRLGWIVFPFFVLGEMLAPLVEVYGLVVLGAGAWLGVLGTNYAIAFFLAAWGYGTLITVTAVVMEEITFKRYERLSDFLLMIGYALSEPVGFRQMTVLWRLEGFWKALRRRREWGTMRRSGFVEARAHG